MFGNDKIRDELKADIRSYADNTPEATEDMLDCSLGINPYGYPGGAADAVSDFSIDRLIQYPHGDGAKTAVADYWNAHADAGIGPENVTLTDGSISALTLLINVFAKKDAEMVCFLPTFTDVAEYSKMMGMKVSGVELKKQDNYRAPVDELIDRISYDTGLVYIDSPNNPTGQSFAAGEIERVLGKCESSGVYCIVDEAYGDFLPAEESAISLCKKYECAVFVRTLSKGFGLAGARAGYIIAGSDILKIAAKISNPYMMNGFSRELACAVLNCGGEPYAHGGDFAKIKGALRDACGDKIIMAVTDDRVPICMLRHVDEDVDLQKYLLRENILTCSGQEFEPLGKNCVRLRVPAVEEAGRLISSVRKLAGQ